MMIIAVIYLWANFSSNSDIGFKKSVDNVRKNTLKDILFLEIYHTDLLSMLVHTYLPYYSV